MINPIDDSFIQELSYYLEGFKKTNNKYNFRCPYCGDSAKNINKKRGWILDYKGHTIFKCFNCGLTTSFNSFLKYINEDIYKRYLICKNTQYDNMKQDVKQTKINNHHISIDMLKQHSFCCDKLNPGSIYLKSRKIQKPELFYYTDDYGSLLKTFNLTEYKNEWVNHEPRLILPHVDKTGTVNFLQFRDLSPNCKLRYKTYRIEEDAPKIWGLDRVNWNKPVYICEGALDASFIDNCIAMSGADADISNVYINNYKDRLHFILDNEPYNKEIGKRYKKLCSLGFKVFLWPKVECKDINNYYLKYNNINIFTDSNNYYNGLKLKLELAKWIKNS